MKKWGVGLLLLYSCVALGADLHVPEEIIGARTVAIVNLNVDSMNHEQLIKSVTDIVGKAPDAAQTGQMKDFIGKFKEAGGKSISLVVNGSKDMNAAKAGDTSVIVVELSDPDSADKFTEFVNTNLPMLKDSVNPDCPRNFDGKLVWYSKNFKLPKKDADRAETFSNAHDQVAEDQLLSVVIVPEDSAVEAAKANLKPQEAEMVDALLGGDGICLFSNFGVAENPTLKVLVLAADAAGAEKINKAVEDVLAAAKKDAPPQFKALLDGLKLAQAGTNVQFSLNVIDWAKIAMQLGK